MKQTNIWHLETLSRLEDMRDNAQMQEDKLFRILDEMDPSYYEGVSFRNGRSIYSNLEAGGGFVTINMADDNSPMSVPVRIIDLDRPVRKQLFRELHQYIDRKISEENNSN